MPDVRVLHVITSLDTGGAEKALFNLLSGGLAKTTCCAVVSLLDEGVYGARLEQIGVPVYTLKMRRGMPGIRVLRDLRRIVREFRPDVLQGWMYHGNLAAQFAAIFAQSDTRVCWNIRHSLYNLAWEGRLSRLLIRVGRFLSPRIDRIVYNSDTSRKQHEAFGYAAHRGVCIPNGFDLSKIQPHRSRDAEVREEFGFPPEAIVVGHVARFHPLKDHVTFLRAAVKVAHTDARARFLIVGRGVTSDNPQLAGIVPENLMSRFVFPGERRDIYRLMEAMNVFCVSSRSEAFPNVLGEAMASGVPCAVTNVGDCAHIVGETGVVVSPESSHEMAEAIHQLVTVPDNERTELGAAARKRVEDRFSLNAVVKLYADLYDSLDLA